MFEKDTTKDQESGNGDDATLSPMVDVIEDASGITLYADLPGVPKDSLSVRVQSDTLSIEGEISLPQIKNLQANHIEVPFPKFVRTFTLGQELDRDKVAAEFKHGVLTLHIPKVERVKPRKIEVTAA